MMLARQSKKPDLRAEEQLKDPFVLEFLELKDEYSESDLEAALVEKLEALYLNSVVTLRLWDVSGDFGSEKAGSALTSWFFIGLRQIIPPHRFWSGLDL